MAHKYTKETLARVGNTAIMLPMRTSRVLSALEETPEQIQLRADAEYGRQMRAIEQVPADKYTPHSVKVVCTCCGELFTQLTECGSCLNIGAADEET